MAKKTPTNPRGAGRKPKKHKSRTFYCTIREIVLDTLLEGDDEKKYILKRKIEKFVEGIYEEEMLRRLNEKMGV